ncbi:MAG: RagB/SusD family nutrient uptake outer membrane protein [Alistipes sp.]|nr:RagB/SusD family nutrient uptake outer membrane protein [Alistipes sp.]
MKSIIKTLIALGAAAASVACMDLEPQDQIDDTKVWGNASNTQLFANQFYGYLRGFRPSESANYMNGVNDGPHSDYRSDLLCSNTVNVFSAGTNSIPNKDDNYNNLYSRLYRTNLLLARTEAYRENTDYAQARGEAYFFRAYLHFELVQLFGDCLLVQKPLDVTSGELQAPRTPRLDVMKAIVQDLKDAAALLPETSSDNGRVNRYAAWAMLSRVALYEGSWQKFHVGGGQNTDESKALFAEASAAADMVMSADYELFHSDELGDMDSYRYMFILEDEKCNPAGITKSGNKEYVLVRRYHATLKHIEFNITHALQNNVGYITSKLADMYRCQDGLPIAKSELFHGYATATSEFDNRDNRMNATMLKNGQAYWNNDGKWRTTWTDEDLANSLTCNSRSNSGYINNKWCTERQVADASESYDYPVIRYAEVLLNYAEAKFEEADAISDDDLNISLNEVRKRSNPKMTPLSNKLCTSNGLSMREEIRAERTVELFLEGFRIDDLKRWKTAEIEMPGDLKGIQFKGTWYETAWTNQTRPVGDDGRIVLYDGRVWEQKHYLYPIPGDQRQLNKQLGQNPEW